MSIKLEEDEVATIIGRYAYVRIKNLKLTIKQDEVGIEVDVSRLTNEGEEDESEKYLFSIFAGF